MQIAEYLHKLNHDELAIALRACPIHDVAGCHHNLLLGCNNDRWIQAMLEKIHAGMRDDDVLELSRQTFMSLPVQEWQNAATHPKIGDRPASHQQREFREQAGFTDSIESTKTEMAELNSKYLIKFG